jgi:predicted esterase
MKQHHIQVPRSARYLALGKVGPSLEQVWFVCHGYSQLATHFIKYFEVLDDGTRVIIAPEGLSRFYVDHATGKIGASWMTKEDRLTEIDDYVRYLDTLYQHVFDGVERSSVRFVALGFSQGAATISRWITRSKVRTDKVILWGGLIPPDVDLTGDGEWLDGSDLTIVVGDQDEYADDERVREMEARLHDSGTRYSLIRFEGGHRMDKEVLHVLG